MSKKSKTKSQLSSKDLHKKGKPLTIEENFDLSIEMLQLILREYVREKERYTGSAPLVEIQLNNKQSIEASLRRYAAIRRLAGLVSGQDNIADHMGLLDTHSHAAIECVLAPSLWKPAIENIHGVAMALDRLMQKKGLSASAEKKHIQALEKMMGLFAEGDLDRKARALAAFGSVYSEFLQYNEVGPEAPSPEQVLQRDCMLIVVMCHMSVNSQFQAAVARGETEKYRTMARSSAGAA